MSCWRKATPLPSWPWRLPASTTRFRLGTWKPGFYYGTIKDGFTGLAPYGPKVSAKTKAQIAAKRKAIVAGKFNVFQGPIYDQSGKLKVKPGQKLRLIQDLYTMQWLVKGVVGKVSSVLPPG